MARRYAARREARMMMDARRDDPAKRVRRCRGAHGVLLLRRAIVPAAAGVFAPLLCVAMRHDALPLLFSAACYELDDCRCCVMRALLSDTCCYARR